MRTSRYSIAAGAIALSATVLAVPTLYKRVADGAKVFSCFTSAFTGVGSWTPDCAAAAAADVGIVQQVSLTDLSIDLATPDPLTMGLSSQGVSVELISVPGISWSVTEAAQHVTIVDNGVDIATFDTPTSPSTVTGGTLKTTIGNCALKVLAGKEDAFSNFIASFISKPSHLFALKGNVDASVAIPSVPGIGALPGGGGGAKTLKVTNVGFSSNITLQSCNNFPKVEYLSTESLTKDATTGAFTLTAIANIHNPSQLALNLGDISLNVVDQPGANVGLCTIKDLKLAMGDNKVTVVVTGSNADVYNRLLAGGEVFTLVGTETSSSNPILSKGMLALKITVTVPKLAPATQ